MQKCPNGIVFAVTEDGGSRRFAEAYRLKVAFQMFVRKGGERVRNVMTLMAVAVLTAGLLASAYGMPSGSFLSSPAASSYDLAAQVSDNPLVAARYAKHFGVPKDTLVSYFRDELRPARLKSDYETVVYTMSGNGDIKPVRKTLRAGTYVFVDAKGRPVLEAATGNPMVVSLQIPRPAPPTMAYPAVPMQAAVGEDISLTIPNASSDTTSAPLALASFDTADIASSAAGPEIPDIMPTFEVVSTIPVSSPGISAAAPGAGALLPIALLGAALAGGGGGGGTVYVPEPKPAPSIPEPASIIALVFGASAMGLGRIRRRK